jgi:hypothetical protein
MNEQSEPRLPNPESRIPSPERRGDVPLASWGRALAAGAVGAATLTAVHQAARRFSDDAPRMDVLGERAIARILEQRGEPLPPPGTLHRWALAGDLAANSIYYSLIACGSRASVWTRAVALGLGAGAGALVLPRPLGLGTPPKSDRIANQVMTVAWYLIGGLAAAAAGHAMQPRTRAA